MTHWGKTRTPFSLPEAQAWVKGVRSVGFMASLHKARMVGILNEVQRDRCGICGKAMLYGRGRRKRNLEHVWPQGIGGLNEPGNLVVAHAKCNHDKGARPPTGCEIIMLLAVCETLDIPLQLKTAQAPWRLPPPGK